MNYFKKLEKEFSPEEIAESYVFPDDDTNEERDKGLELFWEYRRKRLAKQTTKDKLILQLLQLKFLMEDYINSNAYNEKLNFGFFLKEYISTLEIKNKDFAEDISIKPIELSHYISNRRKPNEEIMIKLEIHSNKNIPAIYWCKIVEREFEHEVSTDIELREKEQKKVKNRLEFSF
jgi:hypothetical protein